MTKKEKYNIIKEIINQTNREDKAELIALIEHEINLLVKKNNYSKRRKEKIQEETIKHQSMTGRELRQLIEKKTQLA